MECAWLVVSLKHYWTSQIELLWKYLHNIELLWMDDSSCKMQSQTHKKQANKSQIPQKSSAGHPASMCRLWVFSSPLKSSVLPPHWPWLPLPFSVLPPLRVFITSHFIYHNKLLISSSDWCFLLRNLSILILSTEYWIAQSGSILWAGPFAGVIL